MKNWYKITVYRAHRGAGRNECVTAYIYTENVAEVLKRYRRMPGVKRHSGKNNFPNISRLSCDKFPGLERKIIKEGRISLGKAKRSWYYPELI